MKTDDISYSMLLTIATKDDWTTVESIKSAVERYKIKSGVDLSKATFFLSELAIKSFAKSSYQRLYSTVSDVGQYQLDSGKANNVAEDRMEWFTEIVRAADDLFPSLAVVKKDGELILVDGVHRASARHIAGFDTVLAYTTII